MAEKHKKGKLVYTLEIVYDERDGTIEHIAEGIATVNPVGPINSSFDYMEEYFDMETFKLLEELYVVGEA